MTDAPIILRPARTPPAVDLRDTTPQRRGRLADTLYGRLMEQIANGRFDEGARLPTEKELCHAFDVSRAVVREAMMRLQADGLVVTRQGSGTFVTRRPPARLLELAPADAVAGYLRSMEVRLGLEGEAAKLAARRHDAAGLAAIEAALAAMRVAMDTGAPAQAADFAFHRAVAAASGNALFVRMFDVIAEEVRGIMSAALGLTRSGSRERTARVLEEHAHIHEAIAEGDADGAEIAMRHHLDQARRRLTDRRRDV
jgi:GntR family transcriptional regulator, transcriptional repressor for pyruvate dehydrogenase complex